MLGRPTTYNETIIPKTQEYLSKCMDEVEEYHKTRGEKSDSYERLIRVKLPTIEGLAVYLGVHKDTVYEWEKIHPDFSDVLGQIRSEQANRLINGGLEGSYNPVIAKLLLSSKHGYIEKQENETKLNVTGISGMQIIKDSGTEIQNKE